jgi:hypothetical protein
MTGDMGNYDISDHICPTNTGMHTIAKLFKKGKHGTNI